MDLFNATLIQWETGSFFSFAHAATSKAVGEAAFIRLVTSRRFRECSELASRRCTFWRPFELADLNITFTSADVAACINCS